MTIESLRSALPYDADAPLRPEIERTEDEVDLSVSWIRYDGIRRRRVTAVLVEPEGDGPFGGIVYLHPFSGDKMFFLAEAKRLACEGIVCLLIDAPHRRPSPHRTTMQVGDPASLRRHYLQTIGDVRRGYDLLTQLDTIDARYLGYAGLGEAADLAGAVAALEPRVVAVACVDGVPRRSVYWGTSSDADAREQRKGLDRMALERYEIALQAFDAAPLLEHAHAEHWLFQVPADAGRGAQDELELGVHARATPPEVRSYDAESMASAAVNDRWRWLAARLRPRVA